jgi:hypothetical protein
MASLTNNSSPNETIGLQYPVVAYSKATTADSALAKTINTKLKSVDEAFVTLFHSQYLSPAPVTVDGKLVPSQLKVTAHANRIGELLSVRYDAFFDYSGAATGYSEEQTQTFRMDTGAAMGPSDLLAPTALSGSGQADLAALIAPSLGSDFIFSNQTAAGAVRSALASIHTETNGMSDPVIAVTPAGLEFTFQQGSITPMSNGTPSTVVPFDKLSGLVSPDLAALAGVSAGS